MFHLKAILSHALLAVALALGSGAVLAGPAYHVAIDTSTFGGGSGFLDMYLHNDLDAAPLTATLSNFSGAFRAYVERFGDVNGSVAGSVVIGNGTGLSDFFQEIMLGNPFSFDVSFDGGSGSTGTYFGVAVFNGDVSDYLGLGGDLVGIILTPGQPDILSPNNAFATVTVASAVPEPADWILLATGLALMTLALRRRQQG